jgi:peptide/nickel transport system substrate-binding protein
LACIIFGCIFISGCGDESYRHPNPGILKIGSVQRVVTKNILYDNGLSLFSIVSHPPLLKLERQGHFSGILSDDHRFSADYTSWFFRIKDGWFWSDGKPVTAADVKFTLEFKSRHLPTRKWLLKVIKKIETTGYKEIRLDFHQPYTRLDIELTSIRIFPRHIWKDVDRPDAVESGRFYTGSGPFIIRDVDLNSGTIRFGRNPYWKGKMPLLHSYEIHLYQNLDVLSLALKRGEIDTYYKYADTFPYENLPPLESSGHLKTLTLPESGLIFLGFNLGRYPLSDARLRQAVMLAVDYEEIRRLVGRGHGLIPCRGFIPPLFKYFHPTETLSQNQTLGKTMLKNAGYVDLNSDGLVEDPKGNPVQLNLISTSSYTRLGELVSDYLKNIGINTRMQILDPATWISVKDNYKYDLIISRTTPWGMMMHAGWASGYFDNRRSGEGVLHTVGDPEFIRLCDDLLSTKIPARLQSLAVEIQNYYARKLPAIALLWKTDVIPMNLYMTGWRLDPLFGIYNLDSILNIKLNARH